VLNHIGYITYFDLDLRQPLKTYYTLTVQHAKSLKFKRTTFHQDSLLCKTCQATYADLNNYSKTFDRGHFTPDKDMCWSKRSEREAMVFTNQSFQDKKLNETVWLAIEDFIRKEVIKQNKSAQVWTGVVYSQATISKLNVPKYFWKLVQIGDMQKAWFILNAIPESKDISAYEIKYDDLMKSFDKYNISLR
jgi:DNA/RNA endonuclease G (NUC1)